jgi:hypothetical protein
LLDFRVFKLYQNFESVATFLLGIVPAEGKGEEDESAYGDGSAIDVGFAFLKRGGQGISVEGCSIM